MYSLPKDPQVASTIQEWRRYSSVCLGKNELTFESSFQPCKEKTNTITASQKCPFFRGFSDMSHLTVPLGCLLALSPDHHSSCLFQMTMVTHCIEEMVSAEQKTLLGNDHWYSSKLLCNLLNSGASGQHIRLWQQGRVWQLFWSLSLGRVFTPTSVRTEEERAHVRVRKGSN